LRRDEWRVVKKRERRWGGDDAGWDVSALSSHWRTEILKRGKSVKRERFLI